MKLLSIRTNKMKSNISIEEPYPSWFNIFEASKKNKSVNKKLKTVRYQKAACGKNVKDIDEKNIIEIIKKMVIIRNK